jgi:hypothetical protein
MVISMKKFLLPIVFTFTVLCATVLPVYAATYSPGVSVGEYVKYGNFAGEGAGNEILNDISFQQFQVTAVSGTDVTLLSTGQYLDGSPVPANGTSAVWNVKTGTRDGLAETQGPIIAANLNQGDAIPPQNTYTVNATEERTYLGTARSVNTLTISVSTPDYNAELSYVYDRASGMLLEASSQTITPTETSGFSYSVVETNLFGGSTVPSGGDSTVFYFVIVAIVVIVVVLVAVLLLNRKKI